MEENLDSNYATLRELIEFVTNECAETYDVADLVRKLKSEYIKDYVKNQIKGITLSEVLSTAMGIAGL